MIAYSEVVRIQTALMKGQATADEQSLRKAIDLFAAEKNRDFELDANTTLANLLIAQKKVAQAQTLVPKLNQLIAGNQNLASKLEAKLAIAHVLLAGQHAGAAQTQLSAVLVTATRHGYNRLRSEAAALSRAPAQMGNLGLSKTRNANSSGI